MSPADGPTEDVNSDSHPSLQPTNSGGLKKRTRVVFGAFHTNRTATTSMEHPRIAVRCALGACDWRKECNRKSTQSAGNTPRGC